MLLHKERSVGINASKNIDTWPHRNITMKHYETHFDDYLQSAETCPLHPELDEIVASFPANFADLGNIIVHGPAGVGKYTQVLRILKRYSPSQLKYEKKVTLSIKKQSKKMTTSTPSATASSKKMAVTASSKPGKTTASTSASAVISSTNEKQCFTMTYRISDIHFEIDMSLLGCNSKQIWHELYLQMVDIVAIRPIKRGVIVCKNFHAIHSELLENFYSYVQSQELFVGRGGGVELVYILITEHLSFLPNQLIDRFAVLSVGRPTTEAMISAVAVHRGPEYAVRAGRILSEIDGNENILNLKEMFSFGLVTTTDALPRDNFNIICDALIAEMESKDVKDLKDLPDHGDPKGLILSFRDTLYDILIYGLDAMECVWYVLHYFIEHDRIPVQHIPALIASIHDFAHQYGNNYRAIFHLEHVFLHILRSQWVDPSEATKGAP